MLVCLFLTPTALLSVQFEDVNASVAVLVGGGASPHQALALRGAQAVMDALHTAALPPLEGGSSSGGGEAEAESPGVSVQVNFGLGKKCHREMSLMAYQ